MKRLEAKVKKIQQVKEGIFLLSFSLPYLAKAANPGQFLHIKVDGKTILRRPLSLHSIKDKDIYLLFKVRGRGTLALSEYKKGDKLDILGPLGNGFKIGPGAGGQAANILVGGGMGVAPLVFLGEKLREIKNKKLKTKNENTKDIVILGAKTKKDILAASEFKKLGFKVLIATEDGSCGHKGTVIGLLAKLLSAIDHGSSTSLFVCGPNAMFSALAGLLHKYPRVNCQVSFEQFMGCGIGICCGCVIETKDGYKKVCKDGPVFNIKEVARENLGTLA